MGGGLLQLVSYGKQDIALTGNPQITYFKIVYRRHTNFAMESIEQHFNGTADFGTSVTVNIANKGDLINKIYLEADLPAVQSTYEDGFSWVDEVGHFLIKQIELEIGGQLIDRQYGLWLSIWNSLTVKQGQDVGYNRMIGNISYLTGPIGSSATAAANIETPVTTIHIPLQFWFNKNPGLALPLLALQYHDVKINIIFETFENLLSSEFGSQQGTITATPNRLDDVSLWVDYIFLDTDERRRFAQTPHEYLIEQVQYSGIQGIGGKSNSIHLDFNHPVKELIWVVQSNETTNTTGHGVGNNYTDDDGSGWSHITNVQAANPVKFAKFQLNGHDRFARRKGTYFNLVQPYQHHDNIPALGINVYSFALNPAEIQPSGTLNMSRVDNPTLHLELTDAATAHTNNAVKIFAINYNILKIMSGMGGLAYSN